MKFGFIGLGNIGILIARDLAVSGNELVVHDVSPEGPDAMRKLGAAVAASPAEVARASTIVGVCVRDDKDVYDVFNGPRGLLSAARPELLVAIHSTVRVDTIRDIAAVAAAKGVHVVDAPVSRGVASPSSKGIVFMVGGESADMERVRPFLEFCALKIINAGPLGSGMTLKICNNLLTYLTMVSANDAISLAEAAGLDVKCLAEVTANNGVAGAMLTSVLLRRTGMPMPAHVVLPSPESLINLGEKDLECALEVGRALGIKLPAVTMARHEIRNAYLNLTMRPGGKSR
jgi:3-hydroxyisobutyrate dehydrogenase-like beta-hydroxyacid dehydrogenase